MNINAVSTTPFDIKAALSAPTVRNVSRILAQIGIAPPTAKLKISDLAAKMDAANLDPVKKIELKRALDSANLIDWNA
jgi:hypothetical protein